MTKRLLIIIVCIVAITFAIYFTKNTAGYYTITEVYDGDTIGIVMNGIPEKVRLIGIDTPETKDPRKPVQCYGPEASEFSHVTLEGAKIRLVADPLSSNRDRYDRLLRYVYLQDGRLYNQVLLQNGFARAYLGFPFSKHGIFAESAHAAQENKVGLWAECETI